MKKLIDTPEAATYSSELREVVVSRAGLQMLFEWRYWSSLIIFLAAATVILGYMERNTHTIIVTLAVGSFVVIPGALLWAVVSWRLQRWILTARRSALLHAVGDAHAEAGDWQQSDQQNSKPEMGAPRKPSDQFGS